MFEVIVSGSGVFPAICAIHLARLIGPERVLLATRDRQLAGDCPELVLAGLIDPAPMAIVEDYIVMEWDRSVIIDEQGTQEIPGRACLIDPVQIHAEFVESCPGMTVLSGLHTLRATDGYLIADGNIHAGAHHAAIPAALAGSRQEAIARSGFADLLDCPLLADFSTAQPSQIVPIGGGRILINSLSTTLRRDATGGIDLAATFPLHGAINSLLGAAG